MTLVKQNIEECSHFSTHCVSHDNQQRFVAIMRVGCETTIISWTIWIQMGALLTGVATDVF